MRNRAGGSIDAYAAAIGRWLVTRDGFDFLVYYLRTTTTPRTRSGPSRRRGARALGRRGRGADRRRRRARRVPRALRRRRLLRPRPDARRARDDAARRSTASTTSSSRRRTGPAMVYDLRGGRTRELAERLDGEHLVLFREDGSVVARRGRRGGARELLDEHPQGRESRGRAALAQPERRRGARLGRPGVEFADLGGRHHLGGGSHGSLAAGDSLVPMLTVGLDEPPDSIIGIAPLVCAHFGVEPPPMLAAVADARDRAAAWSSGSSAAAGSPTSACSRRWSASRASCSCRRASAARAYDDGALPIGHGPDDLAAVHGRPHLRGAAAAGDERVLDVGAGSGYQAAVLAELAAEVRRDRGDPRARRAGAREPRRGGLRARRRARRRRQPRRPRARAVRRDRGRRRGARAAARRSTSSWRRAAGSSSRSAAAREQDLGSVERRRGGPGASHARSVPLRAARRRGRVSRA